MPSKGRTKASYQRLYEANSKQQDAVSSRLRELVDDFGGVTAFAREHSLSVKYVYRWLAGTGLPSGYWLLNLAVKSDVSPTWVLTGRGNMYITARKLNKSVSKPKKAA